MALKSLIKSGLDRLGWKLVRVKSSRPRTDAFDDQNALLKAVRDPMIFDIGANHGQTAQTYRRLFPAATIHSFEPFEDMFKQLKQNIGADPRCHAHQLAVSNATGTSTFFLNQSHYTNSLLPSADAGKAHCPPGWTDTVAKVDVRTITMDEFCQREKIDAVDLLKIDVQGAEMLVLQGARGMLERHAVSVIYAEVLFANIYENQTDFCEMFTYLRERGYALYGLYSLGYKHELPISWADAIFISPAVRARLEAAA